MPSVFPRSALSALLVAALLTTTACSVPAAPPAPSDDVSAAPVPPSADLDGFVGSTDAPSPEATITPAPGSWDDAPSAAGQRVVVLAREGDPDGAVVTGAATRWAHDVGAQLEIVTAADLDALDRAVAEAAADDAAVVVGAGPRVVDALALSTPQFLDQQFLLVGAQLAEPTGNVTAVIWPGAGFRGTGISADDTDVAGSITAERVQDALDAGVASIHWQLTGIVIQLP
jgi:basic membrane lipoprotein Med (substrate-binding protein (PBP1-ABC) superfamily)